MEELFKVVLALAAFFGIFKIIHETTFTKIRKHREDYEFAKNYLDDLSNPNTHQYVLEKGFRGLTGDLYSVNEIKALLSCSEPTIAIQRRASCENLIYFDEIDKTYNWKRWWKSEMYRKFIHRSLIPLYFILAFIPTYPLSMKLFSSKVLYELPLSISILLGVVAIFMVFKYMKIDDGIKLMKIFEKNDDGEHL